MQRTHPTMPVIDMHTHLGGLAVNEESLRSFDVLEQKRLLESCGICKAVTLHLAWGDNYLKMKEKLSSAGDYFELFPSVDIYQVEEAGFDTMVYRTLRDYKADGIKGLKLWKDITQKLRSKAGKVIRADSPLFKPIWSYSAEFSLPIVFHLGAQPSFFEPLTPDNEFYQDMIAHPEWNFAHPDMPSYEDHLDMHINLLEENPQTPFVFPHVTGAVGDLKRISQWMDRFPQMVVDISARVAQLAQQSDVARDFFLKYSDRIMFGTDYSSEVEDVQTFYRGFYQYLDTRDMFIPPFEEGSEQYKGIGLPEDVLEKLYYSNSKRILKL